MYLFSSSDLLFVTSTTTLLLIAYYKIRSKFFVKFGSSSQVRIPEGMKKIPMATGWFPIIGHGFSIWLNILEFMNSCYRKYDGVFCVQIFRRKVIIVGNHELVSKYFKEPENSFNFAQALESFNFGWPFYESAGGLKNAVQFLRKLASGTDFHEMVSTMASQAKTMTSRMSELCKDGSYDACIEDEMSKFIAQTTYASFVSVSKELSNDLFDQLKKFNHLVNNCILLSYFLPQWLIKWMYRRRIQNSKKYLLKYFENMVKTYRESNGNEDMEDSPFIRLGLAHMQENGAGMSDRQIAELIIGFMYVSTENTAIGLVNTLTYLSLPENSMFLERLRKELRDCVNQDEILSAPYLNACFHETARISTHFFALHRKPLEEGVVTIGDYYYPGNDVGSIALSGPLLMVYGNTKTQHIDDPKKFYPDRFLGKSASVFRPPNLVTWGGGLHSCPGRIFATYEIKIALSYLVQNFNFDVVKISDWDYFSPIAFAKRNVVFRISKIKLDE